MASTMAAGRSSNPFEDPYEASSSNNNAPKLSTSTNPFDNDSHSGQRNENANNPMSHIPPKNPFDSDEEDDPDVNHHHPHSDGERGNNFATSVQSGEAPSAEASWQYLGDLPYRRVPIYQNVSWTREKHTSIGLSQFPASAMAGNASSSTSNSSLLDARERRLWIHNSTFTQVEGCPHGGPLAAVTLPLAGQARFASTSVRILTNAGHALATIPFPQTDKNNASSNAANTTKPAAETPTNANADTNNPTGSPSKSASTSKNNTSSQPSIAPQHIRNPSDIFKIGFTERGILVVLMRDSLCCTYDIQGQPVLAPFFLLEQRSHLQEEVLRAHIYADGVAIVTTHKQVAICEFLHATYDAQQYLPGAHLSAREIRPTDVDPTPANGSLVALVTPLSVATDWAAKHYTSFRTVAVLPRQVTSHGRPEVFLSTDDHSVVIVQVSSSMDLVDVDCRHRLASPIVDMSFCPNGRFLACFTEASMLTVMSTTFETKVLDFDTSEGSSSPPLAMQWCGEDSVVLHWKNMGILMVGPYGDWLRFPYHNTSAVHLIPEMDACRVITDSTVELLQRVPPMTANLLRIGSIEGSALLLEASDAFVAGTVSDDVLLADNPPKEEDISVCIEAATKEFDILTQKRLLRAASYGMQFLKQRQASNSVSSSNALIMGGELDLGEAPPSEEDVDTGSINTDEVVLPSYTTRQFVAAARKLRILNALRNPQVGFILTVNQYDTLTSPGVLGRLIAMQRPALASRLAVYLKLPKAVQLYARASKAAAYVQKVHKLGTAEAQSDTITAEKAIAIIQNEDNGEEEEETRGQGYRKSPSKNNSSMFRGAYATVAMAATKAGRPGVANLLLLLESSVADKVPALISNGSYVDAMAVATLARDNDYIFSTLMQLEKACLATATNPSEITKAQSAFHQTVIAKLPPEAFHTLRRYYLAGGGAAVSGEGSGSSNAISLLRRAQRYVDAGATLAMNAIVEEDSREKQGMLQEASDLFNKGKETGFYKQCTDEYVDLLKDQEVIRTKYGSVEAAPPSTSVTATIVSLLHYSATHVREQHRLLSDADKIAKKFRIPDRRLWHIKVKAFSESGQWSNLKILADSRTKSPIGYAPFARAAIRGKQPSSEILKYVEKIASGEERCDLLSEAGMWKRALEEAIRIRDLPRIHNVKSNCNSPELQMQADQALAKLA